MKILHFCFVICVLLPIALGYRILGVFPLPLKSHYYVGQILMQGLAERGHEVTVISPFKEKNPIKNYNEIFIENVYEETRKDASDSKTNFIYYDELNFADAILEWYRVGQDFTRRTLQSQNFQNFLKTKKHFDAIVMEVCLTEALLGLMQHFNAPVVVTSAFGATKWTTDLVGSPTFASYMPELNARFTDRMSFWERFRNSMIHWTKDITYPIYHFPVQQKMINKYFPNTTDWPSLNQMQKNVSLVLLNTHVTYGTAQPYAPNMIEVGGMQIRKKVQPLPENIQKFLDEAKNGAILLSFGSNVLLSQLSSLHLNAIQNAFGDYSNTRILIKSEEKISISSHTTENVMCEPWFDQQSVLAHPNVKLFVTHGGLLSTTESIYFGKPMVGIPVFGDQHLNMRIAEQKGYGVYVPLRKMTMENLKSAINKVLGNGSYGEQAKLTSERYRDLLKNPLETGVFWVEHVAKNKGAPYLRSIAVELSFYQLYNLDCWALVFVVLVSILFALRALIRSGISLISSNVKQIKTKIS